MAGAVGTVSRYCGHVALFTFTLSACALLLIIVSYTNTIHCLPSLAPLRRGEAGTRLVYTVCGSMRMRLTHQQQ